VLNRSYHREHRHHKSLSEDHIHAEGAALVLRLHVLEQLRYLLLQQIGDALLETSHQRHPLEEALAPVESVHDMYQAPESVFFVWYKS